MDWMLLPLRRYAVFSGRSRRKEYWMYGLFVTMVPLVLGFVDGLVGMRIGRFSGIFSGLFSLATLLPSTAVGVRRLHDTDRTGWWLAAPLAAAIVGMVLMSVAFSLGMIVAIAGALGLSVAVIVFLCLDGTHGDNRFGRDPKGPDVSNVFA